MQDYLPDLLLAWSIQLAGALSPGPSVALIIGTAISRGRAPALRCAAGVAAGSGLLALATVLGITALLSQVSETMTIIRLLGAAYLLWLAVRSLRKAISSNALPIVGDVDKASNAAAAGFLLQSTNPKAIIFWLAIASVGGVGDAPTWIKVIFVSGACLVSFAAHGAYGLALSIAPVRRAYAKTRRWFECAFGIFFLIASYKLATGKFQ